MTCIRGSRHNFHLASNPATLFSVTAVILLMTAIACENSDDGLGGDSRAATPRLTVITVTPVPIATVDAASAVVSETELPPTASVGGPYSGEAGSAITFSKSATDLGADTPTYEWDFQYNGTTFSTVGATTASGVVTTGPNYTYLTAGTFTVTLRVKGDKGVMTIKSPQIAVTRRCSSFGQPVRLTEAVLPLPLWCCGGYVDRFWPLVETRSAWTS